MTQKTFNTVAAVIFSFVFVLHLMRSVKQWDLLINGVVIPLWVSWVAVAIIGLMAWNAWKLR